MRTEAAVGFGVPVQEFVTERRTKSLLLTFEDTARNQQNRNKPSTSIRSFSGLADHIKVVDGRMPSDKPVNGVYETLVTERVLSNFKIVLGTVLVMEDPKIKGTVKIKPVGVFEKKADDDPYFRDATLNDVSNTFIVGQPLFESEIIDHLVDRMVFRAGLPQDGAAQRAELLGQRQADQKDADGSGGPLSSGLQGIGAEDDREVFRAREEVEDPHVVA
jgi:hypothetical protein